MSKTRLVLIAALLGSTPIAAAHGAVLGSDAAACANGKPSVLVRVTGLKRASGTVKVAIYNSDPDRYLAKRGKLRRVTVPVRSTSADICIAVPGPGRYAVAVHHDLNGNGDKDGSDGLGYSGNPKLSITNLRPAFSKTGFAVGGAPKPVVVRVQYRQGLSIRPVAG